MACPLANERVWTDKHQYSEAERKYYESLSKLLKGSGDQSTTTEISPINYNSNNCNPNVEQLQSSTSSKSPIKKSKKNKNQKNKQLNKQNTNESDTVSVTEVGIGIKECPIMLESAVSSQGTATTNKKSKKDKKKSKTTSTEEQQQAYNTEKDKVNNEIQQQVVDVPSKTKENKDKKNKADKKKTSGSTNNNTTNNTNLAAISKGAGSAGGCTLVSEIAKARQHIKDSLERMDGIAALASTPGAELLDRLATVEKENSNLRDTIKQLENFVIDLKSRVTKLEGGSGKAAPALAKPAQAIKVEPKDDDDVDLFGSDEEEDSEAAAIREKRLQDYAAKKSKKPTIIAKSSIVLDVKCWDDETDMKELERCVRTIKCDGLLWGASKLVPVGYGINKLQISCVVEDDKVSIDWLVDEIQTNEDFVQSVDIAAFNKI